MKGCPFGLGSVVLTFNRYPALVVAASRRLFGLLRGAYFDDNILVDVAGSAEHASQLLTDLFTTLGTPPKPGKHFPPSQYRNFLGTVAEVAAAGSEGIAVVKPKNASRAAVVADLDEAISAGKLSK